MISSLPKEKKYKHTNAKMFAHRSIYSHTHHIILYYCVEVEDKSKSRMRLILTCCHLNIIKDFIPLSYVFTNTY